MQVHFVHKKKELLQAGIYTTLLSLIHALLIIIMTIRIVVHVEVKGIKF